MSSWVYSLAVNGADIYAGGYCNNTACYWKNGTIVSLTNVESYIYSLELVGTDVYAGGQYAIGSDYFACCWKNGIFTSLTNVPSSVNTLVVQ